VNGARTFRLAITLATLAMLPMLAGCSLIPNLPNIPGDSGDNGAATSGPAPDGGDGEADPMFDSIPATFPSDIPLLDG
jgi:hypothetical protein